MYRYRREDNGKIIEVDWATMMGQDVAGFITIKIKGVEVTAKRVHEHDDLRLATIDIKTPVHRTHVSETMGFSRHQLPEMESHRLKNNFSGVEFKPDPDVPGFMNVHIDGPAELERYRKSRNFFDMNSTNGGGMPMPPGHMEDAREKILQKYPRLKNA